jgi:glucokinase
MGEKFELVADIGGTNTRVGLSQNSKLMRQSIEKYPNANVKSLDEILIRYLSAQKLDTVSGVCVALAGPVRNDVAQMTNLSWEITKESLARVTGAKTVGLLNDLQAQGYALDHLSDNQLLPVSGKRAVSSKDTKLVCGIGTGFNACTVISSSNGIMVPAAEAGHFRLPAANQQQKEIVNMIEAKFGFASVENVLSGNGLVELNNFLCPHTPRIAQDIIQSATAGAQDAKEVVDVFASFMGSVLGDLALITLPFGGIYIIGGVARAVYPFLNAQNFISGFCDKGRFSDFNSEFSVQIIDDDFAALNGCVSFLEDF